MLLDFICFMLLFGMFAYVFLKSTIKSLHKTYLVFHFLMMLWPLSHFAVHTTERLIFQQFFLQISFVALSMLSACWLVLCAFLTGHSYYFHRKTLAYAFVPPALVSVIIIWNPNSQFMAPINGQYVDRQYGSLFWIMVVVLLVYFVLSVYQLLRAYRSVPSTRHRTQIRVVGLGVIVLAFFALTDLTFNVILDLARPVPGLISIGIVVSAFLFVIAIMRYKIFNVLDIAQQDIVDSIGIGVLVIDEENIVLKTNEELRNYTEVRTGDLMQLDRWLQSYETEGNLETFLSLYTQNEKAQLEVVVDNGVKRHVVLYASPIFDRHMKLLGRMVTFQDVSELRQAVLNSRKQNDVLQDRNRALIAMQEELFLANQKLEQMAITDGLTGCYNRRYLMQQLEHEVLTNVRYEIPFSIFLFDIDMFKTINDTYGHLIGDEVLRSTADVVKNALRRTDILARYGGEEFTVYLPHTTKEHAIMLANRVKSAVEANQVAVQRQAEPVQVTISMGVLSVETFDRTPMEDGKSYLRELFSNVDQALYEAKHNGRNRIVTAQPL